MIITLPKDVMKLETSRAKPALKSFRFCRQHHRLIVPKEIREMFTGLGLDMYVSKAEKSLYILFGDKKKTQFGMNEQNGYIGCKALFDWFSNTEVPVFDNYQYENYQIDKKNKRVRVKLVRK